MGSSDNQTGGRLYLRGALLPIVFLYVCLGLPFWAFANHAFVQDRNSCTSPTAQSSNESQNNLADFYIPGLGCQAYDTLRYQATPTPSQPLAATRPSTESTATWWSHGEPVVLPLQLLCGQGKQFLQNLRQKGLLRADRLRRSGGDRTALAEHVVTGANSQNRRDRGPSPGRDRQKGKGKPGGAGKGGGKNKTRADSQSRRQPPGGKPGGKPAVDAQAPTIQGLPAPPAATAPALPKGMAPSAANAEQPDSKLLDALVAHVHASNTAPAELRALLETHMQNSTKQEGRLLHRLVTQKQTAKEALERVRAERLHFAAAWQDYITKLLDLWEKQLDEHEKAMAKFNAAESAWQTEYLSATMALKDQVKDGGHADLEEDADEATFNAAAMETEVNARAAEADQQHLMLKDLFHKAKETATTTTRALKRERENSRSPRHSKGPGPATMADPWGADPKAAAEAAAATMARTAAAATAAKAAATQGEGRERPSPQ